ncbi:hypothetical protein CgunFtcFv8_011308 [Champsocephalus gunnari]|uniref:Uncharacterized protein n=1 Tax=Champsocephalus gunnari TaxID=52237 RepID=A0AAN8D478_CHAGU|nr:hypothetical protein CgunFtcFv8_011308 [Champsocephalus gunnari]
MTTDGRSFPKSLQLTCNMADRSRSMERFQRRLEPLKVQHKRCERRLSPTVSVQMEVLTFPPPRTYLSRVMRMRARLWKVKHMRMMVVLMVKVQMIRAQEKARLKLSKRRSMQEEEIRRERKTV